jgi:hypothetical protein
MTGRISGGDIVRPSSRPSSPGARYRRAGGECGQHHDQRRGCHPRRPAGQPPPQRNPSRPIPPRAPRHRRPGVTGVSGRACSSRSGRNRPRLTIFCGFAARHRLHGIDYDASSRRLPIRE